MTVTVNHSVAAQFSSGNATLADLKEIVAAAEQAGLSNNARVTIDYFRGDQRDPSYATITVRAAR